MKRFSIFITSLFIILGSPALSGFAYQEKGEAQEKSQNEDGTEHQITKMTNAKLLELIKRIDPNPTGRVGNWQVKFEGHAVQIITDEKANRMRMVTGIAKAESLDKVKLYRIMQANFESALDARYAIAQKIVWSTYIHPLSALTEKEFYSGLGQTLSLARTYGTTFSSGVFVFGGGDSATQENIHNKIIKKGQEI